MRYAIEEKCVEALEVHRVGRGGSGIRGRTSKDRNGTTLVNGPRYYWII